jgi:nucleotide-binding universal stress UspA family protein
VSDHVLVGIALDDHDAAPIGLGRALARLTTRRLALLHAYPYEPLTMREPEYEEDLRERAEEGLARLAESIDDDDLDVRLYTFPRLSAARALQEAAEQIGAVAVVVGSSRRDAPRKVVAGRTGERLLAGAPCPVGITPGGPLDPDAGLGPMGVAYDGSPEADDALQLGIALARAAKATLTTYTVFEPVESAPAMTTPGWIVPQSYIEDYRAYAEEAARRAKERVPRDLLAGTVLLTGDAALVLAEVSAELGLLICGSRGYGPLRAVLLGSVSARLARSAACPLLITPRGHGGKLAAHTRAD